MEDNIQQWDSLKSENTITAIQIKCARKERDMTQVEVAHAVGVSVPAYRLWEYGGVNPTTDKEKKLRKVLGLGGGKIESGKQDTAS